MCGRYSITTPSEAPRRLSRFTGPLPNLPPRYNVAPIQQVPIVRRARSDCERELAQVRWGLIPFWAEDAAIGARIVTHVRYVTFQMAEVAVPRELVGEILRLIDGLRPRPTPA